jgi:hypothetical protein
MGTTTTEHARLRSRRSRRIIGTPFATGRASMALVRTDARSRRIKPRRPDTSIAVVPFAEMSSPWERHADHAGSRIDTRLRAPVQPPADPRST